MLTSAQHTLIEQIYHAGRTTELRVDGPRRPLPPGVELSAHGSCRRR